MNYVIFGQIKQTSLLQTIASCLFYVTKSRWIKTFTIGIINNQFLLWHCRGRGGGRRGRRGGRLWWGGRWRGGRRGSRRRRGRWCQRRGWGNTRLMVILGEHIVKAPVLVSHNCVVHQGGRFWPGWRGGWRRWGWGWRWWRYALFPKLVNAHPRIMAL